MFTAHVVVLTLYCALLVGFGLWLGRTVGRPDAFFVADRGLGPGLILATVLAANIGAGSTVGAASLGYQNGIAAWWWVGSAGIGTLALAFWVGPRIRRVAQEQSLLTTGDYLEWRYGPTVRGFTTVLLWIATLLILAAQLVAVAALLEAVADVPAVVGCVVGGVVMTAYFTAGGLFGSAWVNLLQLCVLMAGFIVALPLVLQGVGGLEGLRLLAPHDRWLDPLQSGASGWNYLFLLVPPFIVSPGLLQKVYGARDDRAVRLGVGLAGVALLLFAVLPPLLGMSARAFVPDLVGDATNLALPSVLTLGLPLLIGTLGLAAVFSAEISSADAILFMLSTSLSKDLYQRFLRRDAEPDDVLRVARVGALVGGASSTVLAILVGSVIDLMTVFYSLLGVSLFVPVVAGLHSRRAGEREALGAIAAGVSVYLLCYYVLPVARVGVVNPNSAGLLASAVVFGILLLVRRD